MVPEKMRFFDRVGSHFCYQCYLLYTSIVNLLNDAVMPYVRQLFGKNNQNIDIKVSIRFCQCIAEFPTVPGSSFLIKLLCMLCIIFSAEFSPGLSKRFIPFSWMSQNLVRPFIELFGSFETTHRIVRRRLNPESSVNFSHL